MESRGSDMQTSRRWARRLFIPVILVFLLLANNAISPLSSIIDKEEVEKNLFSGLEGSNNQILVVKIDDTKQAIDGYKKQHSKDWLKTLGASDFDVVIETDEETRDIFDASESE